MIFQEAYSDEYEDVIAEITKARHESNTNRQAANGSRVQMEEELIDYDYSYLQLEEYWSLYEQVVPEELWAEYSRWDELDPDEKTRSMSTDIQSQMFLMYDAHVENNRLMYRYQNQEVDAVLWRFYGIQPMHEENLKAKQFHIYKVYGLDK